MLDFHKFQYHILDLPISQFFFHVNLDTIGITTCHSAAAHISKGAMGLTCLVMVIRHGALLM